MAPSSALHRFVCRQGITDSSLGMKPVVSIFLGEILDGRGEEKNVSGKRKKKRKKTPKAEEGKMNTENTKEMGDVW